MYFKKIKIKNQPLKVGVWKVGTGQLADTTLPLSYRCYLTGTPSPPSPSHGHLVVGHLTLANSLSQLTHCGENLLRAWPSHSGFQSRPSLREANVLASALSCSEGSPFPVPPSKWQAKHELLFHAHVHTHHTHTILSFGTYSFPSWTLTAPRQGEGQTRTVTGPLSLEQ